MKKEIPEHGLYTAEIRLTRACNLSCRHCSVAAGKKETEELSTDEVKKIIDQLSEMGALYAVFTGGEPMLSKDLLLLVKYGTSKGLKVSLDTNGTLLSKEKANALKEARVSSVQISIDGTKNTHDHIRGEGTFDQAVLGIKNSIERGIYTTINFTVSRLNQNDLSEVIHHAKELGVDTLTMERFSPMGRGAKIREMLQSPEEFNVSLKELFIAKDLKTNSTDPLSIFMRKDVLEKYSDDELKTRICGGCTAGIAALTISYDGEVYPCPKLEVTCGNIRRTSLLDIWQDNKVIEALRYRRLKGSCGVCNWKTICGGCRAVAHAVSGDPFTEDPTCFIGAVQ